MRQATDAATDQPGVNELYARGKKQGLEHAGHFNGAACGDSCLTTCRRRTGLQDATLKQNMAITGSDCATGSECRISVERLSSASAKAAICKVNGNAQVDQKRTSRGGAASSACSGDAIAKMTMCKRGANVRSDVVVAEKLPKKNPTAP